MDAWLRKGAPPPTGGARRPPFSSSQNAPVWKVQNQRKSTFAPPAKRPAANKAGAGAIDLTGGDDDDDKTSSLLSEEQREVVEYIVRGDSVFITGDAGTGKSYTLREAIRKLKVKHGKGVFVTASTGAAATQVGGTTINAFAGIGLGEDDAATLGRKCESNRNTAKRWRECRALVIDEISMINAATFDKLEHVARYVRRNDRPFGGLQLVVCGDFLQLPPVAKGGVPTGAFFAFESEAWPRCFAGKEMGLTHVFRQRDVSFINVLNEMRVAKLSASSVKLLSSLATQDLSKFAPLEPTRLSCYNADVDKINAQRLVSLAGTLRHFDSVDSGSEPHLGALKRNSNYPARLSLKVNAQVMLLANTDIENGLVNGARGVVEGFALDELGECDGIMVKFASGATHKIVRETSKVEEGTTTKAARLQFPIRLAWCISIHKSQGQTLDLLEVDLRGCFECGQAYTAVSRATDPSRLRLLNFNPSLVKAHQRVVEFQNGLAVAAQNRRRPDEKEQVKTPATPIFPSADDDGWITSKSAPEFSSRSVASKKRPLEGLVFATVGELATYAGDSARRTIVDNGGRLEPFSTQTTTLLCGDSLRDGNYVETSFEYGEARRRKINVLGEAKLGTLLAA